MGQILFTGFLFFTSTLFGQTNCVIGNAENSNSIIYNEIEVDKIIDFTKYNAIFYGEGHVRDFEPEFKLNFIKHLNNKFGVKDIFMEISYSAAYFYNLYLQSGNSQILSDVKSIYSIGKYKSFWFNLYQFNKIKPDSLKTIIHGIDFERTEVFKLLENLKPRDILIPEYLKNTFNDISRLSRDTSLFAFDKPFETEFSKIKLALSNHENDFKLIYGHHFKTILSVLNNKTPITVKVIPRNKIWYKNLIEIVAENNIERFIGFFGAAHLNYENSTSLSVKLEHNKAFQGHILNITGIYHHFFSYGYMGSTPKIFEYGKNEKEIYDKYANKNCRATLVSTEKIHEKNINKKADYILFAKDIVVEY